MSDINGALQPSHESFLFTIESSPLLSQNPILLTPESFSLERGPKYRAYAELRESRLRKKQRLYEDDDETESLVSPLITPPRKKVTFQGSSSNGGRRMSQRLYGEDDEPPAPVATLITPPRKKITFQGNGGRANQSTGRKGMSTMVAKSVPDFSSVLRKENRKPLEMTPPSLKNSSKMSRLGGSKSTGGAMGRKSYASIEELKGLGAGVSSAINGEIKGGRRTILGYRQY
ncbi:hypothetical protein ACHQM5_009431 [Ranunculus cassubicifolius]